MRRKVPVDLALTVAAQLAFKLLGFAILALLARGLGVAEFGFLMFALAFWLLAANYALLGTIEFANEGRVYVFTVRVVAFSLILYGIFDKNRRR